MTHLTKEMLADLGAPSGLAARHQRSEPPFQRTSSLRAYAVAGRTPLVDSPAWDPDDEPVGGSLRGIEGLSRLRRT